MKTQTNTPKPEEDSGEFAGYDTLDAIFAFVFHKEGEAGLRELLAMGFDSSAEGWGDGWGPRESLEDAAYELRRRGLDKPAAVLSDVAQHCASGIDNIPGWCVNYYKVEERPRQVAVWRSEWLKKREWDLERRFPELKRKHAKKARQSQTNEQKPASHKD